MPLKPNRALVAHDANDAQNTSLTSASLSPEAQDQGMQKGFAAITQYFQENELALRNILKQRRAKVESRRVISDIGFNELAQVGLPNKGSSPVFQYVPPKAGQIILRDRVLRDDEKPYIFLIHSFGGGVDKGALRARNVKSIAVDLDTGFSPKRYYNGVRELVATGTTASKKSIHHLISRRGDLTNSAPWDVVAFHGGGPNNEMLQNQVSSINHVSIGIELEEYYIRHNDESRITAIINRVPYTDQQYAVIAFLLKKHILWTGNTDILRWLGPTPETIANVRNKQTGCALHLAFNPEHADPHAEFLFPQGFTKGDPIPSHLSENKKDWERRIELFHGDKPQGTPLSAWDIIFDKVARIREFTLSTEVFNLNYVNPRIPLETPIITGTHTAALAGLAGRDQITHVERTQQLQSQTRAQIYDKARSTASSLRETIANHSSRLTQINNTIVKPAVISNAEEFDYATGEWVRNTTKVRT